MFHTQRINKQGKRIPFIKKVSKIINNNCRRKCIMQVECSEVLLDPFIIIIIHIPYGHQKKSMNDLQIQVKCDPFLTELKCSLLHFYAFKSIRRWVNALKKKKKEPTWVSDTQKNEESREREGEVEPERDKGVCFLFCGGCI